MASPFYKKSTYKFLLKILLFILLALVLYKTIGSNNKDINWDDSSELIRNSHKTLLAFAIFLMPFNWFLESYKWKLLMNVEKKEVTFLEAVTSTFVGVTFGFVTPFKAGDYVGRMLLLRSDYKGVSFYATFISSIYQNVINLSFGLCGAFLIFNRTLKNDVDVSLVIIFNLIVVFLGWLLILKHEKIINYFLRFSFIQNRLGEYKLHLLSLKKKATLFAATTFRYLIYVAQYMLLINCLNVDVSIINLFAGISAIYLIQSSIPLPPFLGLLARAELSILIWGLFSISPLIALFATFMLWVINLVVPALIGMVITFKKW